MAKYCDNERRSRRSDYIQRSQKPSTSYGKSDGNWKRRKINAVAESSESDDIKELDSEDTYSSEDQDGMIKNLALGHRRKGKNSQPLFLEVSLNNILVTMEIDCGASFSVMSNEMYLKFFSTRKLKPQTLRVAHFSV